MVLDQKNCFNYQIDTKELMWKYANMNLFLQNWFRNHWNLWDFMFILTILCILHMISMLYFRQVYGRGSGPCYLSSHAIYYDIEPSGSYSCDTGPYQQQ